MKQGLLGIEAEVELGCKDDAMLSELLDAGIVLLPLSDKKIRISANAGQGSTVAAVLMKREPLKCSVFFNYNTSHGGIQETCILTSKKLTDPTDDKYDASIKRNRLWGYYDTSVLDRLVEEKGVRYV